MKKMHEESKTALELELSSRFKRKYKCLEGIKVKKGCNFYTNVV